MGRASTPKWDYKGYHGKARRLLDWMKRGETSWAPRYYPNLIVRRDGPWVRAGDVPNVGAKMLAWMMEQGMIERRGDTQGVSVVAIKYDWYRIPVPDDDLGDLWIE